MAAITLEEILKEVSIHPEKLDNRISDDHLREIALFLTSWRTVASYLDLDVDAIEQEGKSEQTMKLKALKIWKGKFGFRATYKKLVEVLLSLAMADVVEKVCHLLKGKSNSNHIRGARGLSLERECCCKRRKETSIFPSEADCVIIWGITVHTRGSIYME